MVNTAQARALRYTCFKPGARTWFSFAVQNDTWQVFPDQGDLDEQRWAAYSCPETYESSTGESSQTR